MRMLSVVALAGAVAAGSYVSAQDAPVVVTRPIYTADAMRARVGGGPQATCGLADKTEHPVTTEVAAGGRRYRCVAVLDESFRPAGAAWTPVQQP